MLDDPFCNNWKFDGSCVTVLGRKIIQSHNCFDIVFVNFN